MSWVWEAKLDCGHSLGGVVESRAAFVTPHELQDETFCPMCKGDRVVVMTTGRGR